MNAINFEPKLFDNNTFNYMTADVPNSSIKKLHLNKYPVTRSTSFRNLQRNSTLRRCKIGIYMFPSLLGNIFLTYQTFFSNLHLLRVELRCKLQEK